MTAFGDDPGSGAIRLERVYTAPVADIWALWTTKEGFEAWFAPEGMRIEVLALDLRVGGVLDHVLTAVGAEQVAYLADRQRSPEARVRGRFVEIVPERRLRIRFDMDFVPGVASYPYDMLVELHAEAGRVRMVLTADRHPDPDMTRGARLALDTQLRHFDRAVAARTHTEPAR